MEVAKLKMMTALIEHRVKIWGGGGYEEKGERRKEKSASKREQRQVYLSVAERKQIQDRKA